MHRNEVSHVFTCHRTHIIYFTHRSKHYIVATHQKISFTCPNALKIVAHVPKHGPTRLRVLKWCHMCLHVLKQYMYSRSHAGDEPYTPGEVSHMPPYTNGLVINHWLIIVDWSTDDRSTNRVHEFGFNLVDHGLTYWLVGLGNLLTKRVKQLGFSNSIVTWIGSKES